jgi:hypothetical protein
MGAMMAIRSVQQVLDQYPRAVGLVTDTVLADAAGVPVAGGTPGEFAMLNPYDSGWVLCSQYGVPLNGSKVAVYAYRTMRMGIVVGHSIHRALCMVHVAYTTPMSVSRHARGLDIPLRVFVTRVWIGEVFLKR